MMKSGVIILFISLFVQFVQAQNSGFYGKKVYLDLQGQGQLPLFANLSRHAIYTPAGSRTWLYRDLAGSVSLGFVTNDQAAVAMEYNYRVYDADLLRTGEINRHYVNSSGQKVDEYQTVKSAPIGIREQNFILKSVVAPMDGRVPTGLSHEFGIGYSIIRLDTLGNAVVPSSAVNQPDIMDRRAWDLKGMTIFYGSRLSFPINKSLLFNIGFRYSYNPVFGRKKYRKMSDQSPCWEDPYEIWRAVNHRRTLGIISFRIGFTFCF